ncbi:hypothetical protein P3T27_003073 [Kitasatospora sp. MAA19]|uniref:hypothetical protein n=1 Tax=unclassified Kitasatospora TaxID=2633591 RepID=UPI00247506B0|nr:hypothetical protein [Kitasatospora sp. MAA19]MDH6706350.1 hypothetical protein [Kitasatospora sp. MAA19]
MKAIRHMALAAATGALALAGTMATAGTAQAAYDPTSHSIWDDEPLYAGWHVDSYTTRLIMQADGDLVIYQDFNTASPKVPFRSGTTNCGYKTVMQSDGNLVVYSASGGVCWALGTDGHPHAKLVVNDSGAVGVTWGSGRLPRANTGDPYSRFLSSDLY